MLKTRLRYCPVVRPGDPRPPKLNEDPMENCAVKSVLSCAAGGLMGGVMGLFLSSMDTRIEDARVLEMSTREQIKHSFVQMRLKSVQMSKQFAVVGGAYAGVECLVSKTRGKTDIYTSLISGCVTGGGLAIRAGT